MTGRTPLQLAISGGDEEIVKLLIDKNAMLNAKDIDGNTSVHYAVRVVGDNKKSLRILELLIGKGVNLNIANHLCQTSLHFAVKRGFPQWVKLLLDNGAKLVQDNVGRTPLHYAVSKKNDSIVKLLTRQESLLDLADEKGKTSLHLAAEIKYAFGVSMLLESGANINVKDDLGNTPLHYYVLCTKKQRPYCKPMINLLINSNVSSQKNEEGMTPLHCAVDENNFTAVELLLRAGAEVNERDVGGRTPLHQASMRKYIKSKIMKALLECGAQVDCRDELDRTPLHWAAIGCFVARGSLLIEYGADINAKDSKLNTPLHLCMSKPSSFGTLLLDKGCEMDLRNIDGNTPLIMAVETNLQSIANQLISKGADISDIVPTDHISTDFHLKCSAEIEKMKAIKFNHNALSDILLKYSDLTFLSNDDIRKKIFSTNLDDDLPVYSYILRAAYTKAKNDLAKSVLLVAF